MAGGTNPMSVMPTGRAVPRHLPRDSLRSQGSVLLRDSQFLDQGGGLRQRSRRSAASSRPPQGNRVLPMAAADGKLSAMKKRTSRVRDIRCIRSKPQLGAFSPRSPTRKRWFEPRTLATTQTRPLRYAGSGWRILRIRGHSPKVARRTPERIPHPRARISLSRPRRREIAIG